MLVFHSGLETGVIVGDFPQHGLLALRSAQVVVNQAELCRRAIPGCLVRRVRFPGDGFRRIVIVIIVRARRRGPKQSRGQAEREGTTCVVVW